VVWYQEKIPALFLHLFFFLRVFVCYALVHLLVDYEIYLADIGANVNRYRIDE